MFIHYLKLAYRRLIKFKINSFINIFGLGVALSVCIVIMMYSVYHLSFDRFVEDYDNSYRLIGRYGDGSYNPKTFTCFGEIVSELPEVKSRTMCFSLYNLTDEIFVGERKYHIDNAQLINSSFFPFFSAQILEGSPESIDEPNTVMVTPQLAEQLFPNESPIGKTISLRAFTRDRNDYIDYSITGIVKPLPKTSHIGYDILLSQKGHFSEQATRLKKIKTFAASVYMKLYPNSDMDNINKELSDKATVALDGVFGPPVDAFDFKLQAFRDIHFGIDMMQEYRPTIRRSNLNVLLLVGLIIFIIATVNFINMFVAQSSFYRRESAIMQFLGSKKVNIWGIFFAENVTSISIAFGLSIVFLLGIKFMIPQHLFGWTFEFSSLAFWISILFFYPALLLIVTLLSYLNLSGILPEKTTISHLERNRTMPSLVVLQFVIVIGLIAFTFLVNKQLDYVQHKDLGYHPENVLVINMPKRVDENKLFVDELKKSATVLNASSVMHYPGYRLQDMNLTNQDNTFPFTFGRIEYGAIETLGMKVIKTIAPERLNNGWLINNSFYQQLKAHYSDEEIALGNFLGRDEEEENGMKTKMEIVGVLDDFNYASLHSPIKNFAFFVNPKMPRGRITLVRFQQSQEKELLAAVQKEMDELFPGFDYIYSFMDEQLAKQYKSEQTLMSLINIFSLLAILIACIGLISLSLFIMERRTKEIGIRKVNGATISEILILLNRKFIFWVLTAFVAAIPITWFAMNKWLENFAYKTDLSWWIFSLAGLLALGIALVTVSWQSWKTATRNPVEALRYE